MTLLDILVLCIEENLHVFIRHSKTSKNFYYFPFQLSNSAGKTRLYEERCLRVHIGKCVPVGNSMLRQIFQTDEL